MARTFSKTLTVTRTAYKTVEVVDGVPQFVDHHDAVFNGILEKEKVERMLRGQLGKDAIIVVTNIESGQHRYEMDLETFVLNARITDGESEESTDGEDGDGANPDPIPTITPDSIPDAAPDSDNPPAADLPASNPAPQEDTAETTPAPKPEYTEDDDGVDGVDDPF